MKPKLKKFHTPPMYYYRRGLLIEGPYYGLWGNVSGLWGSATGLRGDLDACEVTDAKREHCIDVAMLARSEP